MPLNFPRLLSIPVSMVVMVLLGCAPSPSVAPPDPTDVSAAPAPVPSSSASPEPTTTAASPTPAPVDVIPRPIVTTLEHPWGMAWLPDGTLLITERPGRLRVVRDEVLDSIPVAGLPDVFAQGQGGLMDIAIHPEFEQTPWIYLTYAAGDRQANHTQVVRARWDDSGTTPQLRDLEVIVSVRPLKPGTQHFGSRLAWLPDHTLLVSIGDGGNPPVQLDGELIRLQAQDRGSHLGKILRLHDDGSIPADNPFVDTADADPAVWSYGHRNIQGLAYDAVGDRLWASEHGARGGDELNRVDPGQNYGWPIATHSQEYTGGSISPHRSQPGMVDPLVVWTPAIAPSGLAVYDGDAIPPWQGQLFAGGLVSRDIQRFTVAADGSLTEVAPIAIGQRVRDVRQGPDGFLYVLTDEVRGQLLRLEPRN